MTSRDISAEKMRPLGHGESSERRNTGFLASTQFIRRSDNQ